MGEVYQARDTRLDRIVAIKVLGATNGRQDLRERFQREARAISKLNHPHVCTVHDVGQHNGIDYLVMEYLKGETLEDRLNRSSLALDEVLRFGIQIANGLDRAHRSGIEPALDKKQPDPAVQVEIVAPEGAHLSPLGSAISPDGRYVAFVANSEGKDHLWLRPLNARTARILEDTEDAQFPFWSPDSSSIGFFTGTKLKRFDLNGAGTRTLATALFGRGGTWSRDGVILYAPALNSRLWKVSAGGGEPTPVTVLDGARGDARHIFPQFLPDGKHFLFVIHAKDAGRSGAYLGTLEDPSKVEPIPELQGNAFQAVFAPSRGGSLGYLIYAKERSLVAQLFDLRTLRVRGEAQPIVSRESFSVAAFPGFLNVSASLTGTLLDGGASQRARNELVWRARDGRLLEVAGEENDYISPAISPDGSRFAVTKADADSGDYDIWIENLKAKMHLVLPFITALMFIRFGIRTEQASSSRATRPGFPLFFESRSQAPLNLSSCSRSRKRISMGTTSPLTAST
jgi:Protein kinase domain/WD40-like Beta Propeller Repeat